MTDEVTSDQLGIDDLIDALGARLRWDDAHSDLSEYWSRRYELLRDALHLDPVNETQDDPSNLGLRWILRNAAEGLWDSPNPFSGILEGNGSVAELYRRFAPDLEDLHQLHVGTYRAVARDCLLALDPELLRRTCPPSVLTDGGISTVPPNPDDYW